jgi:hypothetical protein
VSASGAAATRRDWQTRAVLIEAYRDGLGLAALAIVRDPAASRVVALAGGDAESLPGEVIVRRWWCRRADEARHVAAAAMRRLGRRYSPPLEAATAAAPIAEIAALIEATAARAGVALYSDAQVAAEADEAIARVDAELDKLQRAGELKSVNASYRTYRLEVSARGEKVQPYAAWFNGYRATLVRQLANTLRQF